MSASGVELITSFYEAFAKRDAEGMVKAYADDVHFSDPVFIDLKGDRAKNMWRMLCERGKDLAITFRDVKVETQLWRDEIFGPVLACCQAPSFQEAVCMALGSEYALTGGVFSRSPANLQYARRHFKVGNLYLNRGCTGALVGRQPFGGFKMSGIGSKAGGPDYLLQFVEPRVVTENTMRRGFAPELE